MKKLLRLSFVFAVMTAAFSFAQDGAADIDKLIADYSEAIKRDSSDLDAYWFRTYAYYQTKNYDAAIADCTTLIMIMYDTAIV